MVLQILLFPIYLAGRGSLFLSAISFCLSVQDFDGAVLVQASNRLFVYLKSSNLEDGEGKWMRWCLNRVLDPDLVESLLFSGSNKIFPPRYEISTTDF